ncbi:MAG: hypothetical protein IJC15_08910 [Clostridia bacterium]|nr:hypothetical protein [Clostridia bacterium]
MKKHTKICAGLLCALLVCLMAATVVNAEQGGMMSRAGEAVMDDAESMFGEVTGAITDNSGANSPMEGGTNIPEDSNGVITDPVTDDMRGDSDNSTEQSEGMTTRPDTTRADTTVTGTATDTQENAPADDEGGNGFVGVIVAVIIAIAVILLIIALMPRKRIE